MSGLNWCGRATIASFLGRALERGWLIRATHRRLFRLFEDVERCRSASRVTRGRMAFRLAQLSLTQLVTWLCHVTQCLRGSAAPTEEYNAALKTTACKYPIEPTTRSNSLRLSISNAAVHQRILALPDYCGCIRFFGPLRDRLR